MKKTSLLQKANSEQRTARIIGVLLILAMISSLLSGIFLKSKNATDYLGAISSNEYLIFIGVLFMLVLTASVVSIPIVMYPIFKKHNESLAIGYIGARIFEGVCDFIMAIASVLLVILSREVLKPGAPNVSYFQASGSVILGLYDWISLLENIPYCLGAITLFSMLYQSKLVPRWLSIWGLSGAVILLIRVPLDIFVFGPLALDYLAIPIFLSEIVLAIWLFIKGFKTPTDESLSIQSEEKK